MNIFFISKDVRWQKYRVEILRRLAKEINGEVEILTTGVSKPDKLSEKSFSVKTFRSLLPLKMKVSFFPGAIGYLFSHRPSAVLAVNNTTQFTEYMALLVCKLMGIPFIWWTHGYDHARALPSLPQKLKSAYALFFLKRADAVITFSEKGREYLVSKGVQAKHVFTAPNTLLTDDIIARKEELERNHTKAELKEVLGVARTDRVLLFTGRLNTRKRVGNAIKALKYLGGTGENIKLVVVGDGPDLTRLQELARRMAPGKVIFLGALYDDKLLDRWFSVADLYVMPGYVGLAIVHAFCFGLPFVCEEDLDHGPEFQYLKNGVNGICVERDNVRALGEGMKSLLRDEDRRARMSAMALQAAQTEAGIGRMMSGMKEALEYASNPVTMRERSR